MYKNRLRGKKQIQPENQNSKSDQLGQQKEESGRKAKKGKKQIKKLKKIRDKQAEPNQGDSFMDEQSEQISKRDTQNKQQQFIFKYNHENENQKNKSIVLLAQISQDESQSESEDDSQGVRPKEPKKKQKKQKGKGRGKSIKRKNLTLDSVNQEDIIEFRSRPKERKNYNEKEPAVVGGRGRAKLNFSMVSKQAEKVRRNEKILISSVVSEGFVGPYRYFQVRLRGGERVFIKQKQMNLYFSSKLTEYRQRILNKVSKSTEMLNFAV